MANSDGPSVDVDLARRMARLQARVARLELVAVRAVGGTGAILLAIGALLPFIVDESGDDPLSVSVLTAGFGSGAESSEDAPFVIGFLGLVACVVAAIVVLLSAPVGKRADGPLRFGRVVLVLLAIGTLVTVILTLVAAGNEGSAPDPPCSCSSPASSCTASSSTRTRRTRCARVRVRTRDRLSSCAVSTATTC